VGAVLLMLAGLIGYTLAAISDLPKLLGGDKVR
jgi:hypothetical protein